MRLALADTGGVEQLEALHAIGLSAFPQGVEPRQLAGFGRDDQFPDSTVLDAFLVAVLPRELSPLDAEPRLERTRRIVDARMDDAAVVSRLVLVEAGLFLDAGNPQRRVAVRELSRGRKPDDPAADDGDVVGLRNRRTRMPA